MVKNEPRGERNNEKGERKKEGGKREKKKRLPNQTGTLVSAILDTLSLSLSLVPQFLVLSHAHTLARNEGGERKTNVVLRGNNIITTIVQHWDDDKTGLLHWCLPASVSLWEC